MKGLKATPPLLTISLIIFVQLSSSVNGQVSSPCTVSMISSFTPCINFVTGSSANGSMTPTAECCRILKSLMSTSLDCGCLLVTGNVPLPVNLNQTLALSLPRMCNKGNGGMPVQCQDSGAPLPSPGPVQFGGGPPPASDSSPRASKAVSGAAFAPVDPPDAVDASTDAAPQEAAEPPSTTTSSGIIPVPTPSASSPSGSMYLPTLVLIFLGFMFPRC